MNMIVIVKRVLKSHFLDCVVQLLLKKGLLEKLTRQPTYGIFLNKNVYFLTKLEFKPFNSN